MKQSLFRRYILRSWSFMMIECLVAMLTALVCTFCFQTLVGIMFFVGFSALLLFQWKFRKAIKKRGCGDGTLSESDTETYLFRGNDGSELRVPKNSPWMFVERDKNGNAERILYSPVFEFTPQDGNPVPAPDIPTQRAPRTSRKLIVTAVLLVAEVVLVSWLLGKYIPLSPSVVYRTYCPCTEESDCCEAENADCEIYSE